MSVYYRPTDSHSYLLYSSSHPSPVKNSILFSQFLRLYRLCSDDSDFSEKSEAMCQFFDKRSYPASVVQAGYHRAQLIDRQSALQTAEKENTDRIPFILEFHPHNHAVKSRNDKDESKPVVRHFNLPNHSKQHMAVCGLSLHLGSSESRSTLEQKFIFQIGTPSPHGINERFSLN